MSKRNWEKEITLLINFIYMEKEGEIISYSEIENLLSIERYEPEFNYILSRARAELIKNSIVTKTIIYEGIKKLKSDEIADYIYEKYLVSSLKKQETALNILKYIDKDKLKKEDIKELESLGNLIKNINGYSTDEVIKSQLRLNKAKTLAIGGV